MHGLRIRLSTEADSLPDSEDYVGVKSARVIPGPSLPLARSLPCIIQFLHHPTIHKLVHSHILGPKPPQLYTASKKSKARYAGPRENVGPHLLEFARCSLSYKSSSCGAFPQILPHRDQHTHSATRDGGHLLTVEAKSRSSCCAGTRRRPVPAPNRLAHLHFLPTHLSIQTTTGMTSPYSEECNGRHDTPVFRAAELVQDLAHRASLRHRAASADGAFGWHVLLVGAFGKVVFGEGLRLKVMA